MIIYTLYIILVLEYQDPFKWTFFGQQPNSSQSPPRIYNFGNFPPHFSQRQNILF